MKTTKVFKSGNSKAVRIPKDILIEGDEVEILKRDNEIIIREIPKDLTGAFKLLSQLPDDFFDQDREDTLPQDREF